MCIKRNYFQQCSLSSKCPRNYTEKGMKSNMTFSTTSEPLQGLVRKKIIISHENDVTSAGNGGHVIIPADNVMTFIPTQEWV